MATAAELIEQEPLTHAQLHTLQSLCRIYNCPEDKAAVEKTVDPHFGSSIYVELTPYTAIRFGIDWTGTVYRRGV